MDYVSDDFVRDIFSTYLIYAPATKDDNTALDMLKSFLCKALNFHISEKINNSVGKNHEQTLSNIKKLDYITKDLIVKSRLYADIINNI